MSVATHQSGPNDTVFANVKPKSAACCRVITFLASSTRIISTAWRPCIVEKSVGGEAPPFLQGTILDRVFSRSARGRRK